MERKKIPSYSEWNKFRRFLYILFVFLGFLLTNTTFGQPVIKLIISESNFTDFVSSKKIFKDTEEMSSFTIRNTGTDSFTGVINYKDTWGSSLELQEVTVTYEGGALPSGTTVSWEPTVTPAPAPGMTLDGSLTSTGTLVSGVSYQLNISNLPVSANNINKGLIITRRIKVVECIDDNLKGLSLIELQTCINGNNCNLMEDSWQADHVGAILPRLIQRINKADNKFIDVFNLNISNSDFCAYDSASSVAGSGMRKVSMFAKMHNSNSGEVVNNFAFQIWSLGNEEISLSEVKFFKAALVNGNWQTTGTQLVIPPEYYDPTTNYERPLRADYSIPVRCFNDAIHKAYFNIGDLFAEDAYYVEFNVYNCNPIIDPLAFSNSMAYDNWTISWRGEDDCGGLLNMATIDHATITPPPDPMNYSYIGDPSLSNTNYTSPYGICGACYHNTVTSTPLYLERVSSLMKGEIGNCRIKNQFVANKFSFLATGYSDGINYNVDNAKVVVILKLESGLDYFTSGTPSQNYQYLHFRRQDGKNWIPVVTEGTTPAYNIQTNESPYYDYSEIRMFEFNMSDLYALFPPVSFSEKPVLLYEYLNDADITYSLLANCDDPNSKEQPNYTVEMYLISDANCDNPLVMPSFKITKNAGLMCPGCKFPGGAGRFSNLKRINFGLNDSQNNNGIPDDGASLTEMEVNTLNSDNNPDNDIRTNFGIVGDRLKMNTRYYLTSSELCNGILYDDMMLGELKYSYLKMSFPGDTFEIDHGVNVKVIITRGATDYTFRVPMSTILVQSSVNSHLFEIDLNTITAYEESTPALPVGFRFESFDEIELEFFLDIRLNSATDEVYQEVFIIQHPYFSATPLTQYVRDFPQFRCVDGTPVIFDDLGNVIDTIPALPFTDINYTNTWLLCEGYQSIFNLLKVTQQYYYADGYTLGDDLIDKSCNKNRFLSIQSSIGKYEAPKIFSNEFRPAPMIEAVDIVTPDGYRFKELYINISDVGLEVPLDYKTSSFVSQGIVLSPSSTTTIGTETYTLHHLQLPPLTIVTDVDVISGDNKNKGRQVDERLIHNVVVIHEAVCSEIPEEKLTTTAQPLDTTSQGLEYRFKMFFDQDDMTDLDVFVSNVTNEYVNPLNQLTSTLSSTGVTVTTASGFDIDFNLNNGSNGSPAKFPFVTIEYDQTIFADVSISGALAGLVTEISDSVNGNILTILYQVDPDLAASGNHIVLNGSVALNITGKLIQCFNDPNIPALLKVGFGWDCNGWPSSATNLNTLCYYQSEFIEVFSLAAGLQENLTASSNNGDCTAPKIHYDHLLINTGSEVNEVSYFIDLPTGLTLDVSSIQFSYGTTILGMGYYSINDLSTTLNPEQYQLVLSSSVFTDFPLFASAVVQGNRVETINLQFDAFVSLICNEYQPTSSTIVNVTSKAFCGTVLHNDRTIVPSYTACLPFTIALSAPSLACLGNAVNLSASLINTVGSGYQYTWTVNGVDLLPKEVDIIDVNSPIEEEFFLSSTSEITITIKNVNTDCVVSDTRLIVVNELPSVSINPLPAEFCFGTTPITLTGIPSGGTFSGTGVSFNASAGNYEYNGSSEGVHVLTYTYTDSVTTCTNTDTASIMTSPCCPYRLNPVTPSCGTDQIQCLQLEAVRPVQPGIKGMDFIIRYNSDEATPVLDVNGIITATYGDVVLNGLNVLQVSHSSSIQIPHSSDTDPDKTSATRDLHVSIFYNSTAPFSADWEGIGNVICLNFQINATSVGSLSPFKIGVIQNSNSLLPGNTDEEYSITTRTKCVENGGVAEVEVIPNTLLTGVIRYHNTSDVLKYNAANPAQYNETLIQPVSDMASGCVVGNPANSTHPDLNGQFAVNMTGSSALRFERDIDGDYYSPSCTIAASDVVDVMTAMNGYDSYLMESITTLRDPLSMTLNADAGVPDPNGTTLNDASRKSLFPTPYQMIAADVNINGRVRANDITWLQQRAVSQICEFPQAWNYTESGNSATPNMPGLRSYDWRFTNKTGTRSASYPYIGGAVTNGNFNGYWRDEVPQVENCIEFSTSSPNECSVYPVSQTIYAVLLGDLDGSWRPTTTAHANVKIAAVNNVLLDYSSMIQTAESVYRIPVTFEADETIVSLDFVLNYDETKIKILSVGNLQEGSDKNARMVYNDFNNTQLLLSSYTMSSYSKGADIFYIEVMSMTGTMSPAYLGTGNGFLNGKKVALSLQGASVLSTTSELEETQGYTFEVIPNPNNGTGKIVYNVKPDDNARIVIYNAVGQVVQEYVSIKGNGSVELNPDAFSAGMYQVILHRNETDRKVKKMVIYK